MNINEIAKMAGVSRATVSRYLNQGYVSAAKKEQIRKVIEKTGYQPSSSAQTLRSKRTNYIGVIIPKINSASIARMVSGISETLSASGYQLLLACTDNNENEELKYLNLFKENHVDGIILLGTIFTPAHKKLMQLLAVPIVILGQYAKGYSCVYQDDYSAARSISEYMAGHASKWGYLGVTDLDEAVGKNRKKGLLDALSARKQSIADDAIKVCAFSLQSGYEQAKELLLSHPDLDTILCATDTIAAGALKYITESGRRVPEDIQLAGIGDSNISLVTTPTLTTVHFYYKTSGIEATKALLAMIQNPEHAVNKELKLGYRIVENCSTRC